MLRIPIKSLDSTEDFRFKLTLVSYKLTSVIVEPVKNWSFIMMARGKVENDNV